MMNNILSEKGKCLSGAGQSLEAVFAMEKSLGKGKAPKIIALYEALNQYGYCENTDISEAVRLFPGIILQIGLQLPVNNEKELINISSAAYAPEIVKMAKVYKQLKNPVILRIGYEFDGIWNNYRPEPFKKAFQAIRRVLAEQGADNVTTMFNSYIPHNKNMYDYYPGDEYVDFIGFNTLQPKYDAGWFCEQAKLRGKPVMIGESSYAIDCKGIAFEDYIKEFFEVVTRYDVTSFQYINWEWDLYPENMDWKEWSSGRFTEDAGKVNAYINALPKNMIFRDESQSSPLKLFCECARKFPELKQSGIWMPNHDAVTAYDGFGYEAAGMECRYNDGFNTAWHSGEKGVIKLFYPPHEGYEAGYCLNGKYVHIELPCNGRKEIVIDGNDCITKLYIAETAVR